VLCKSAKNLIVWTLAFTHVEPIFFWRLKQDNAVIVLNLHRISPVHNPFWAPLSPTLFEQLLQFLQTEFTVTTLGRLQHFNSDKPVAVLSFDDGYADFTEYAAPLLRKYGFAVNMNVIPAAIESGLPPWNVRLYDWLASASVDLIRSIRLAGFTAQLAADDIDSKAHFGLAISRFLKQRPRREREELWRKIEPMVDSLPMNSYTRMMRKQDVLQAARDHEIGVHSYTHESMAFESDEFFYDDFRSCCQYFGQVLNLPLAIYAFPNGSYRANQVDYLLQHGVSHVLLVGEKFGRRSDRVLPRITVAPESWPELRFTALGYRARRRQ
jgi:peptidoglycan/xylan/chitin deacetylase (PgdA/CDA1 family)